MPPVSPHSPEQEIHLLQEELAQTNREVMALTLELEARLEQLRAAEERYRRLAENAPDLIYRYEVRPVRGFSFVNPRATAVTGFAPEEHYKDPELYLRLVHPDDRALLEAVLRGETPGSGAILLRWRHKNGSIIWMEQHHSLVHDPAGTLVAVECIARDVTERKNLEEQFRQSQKMEAIGRLAGGVAHDFNNLLTVITGYSANSLSVLRPEEELYEGIQEISKAADRAAALTRQLLAFSRRQVLQPQVFDLNEVVADMDRMLRRVLGEDVELQTVLNSGLGSILADRGQMEQVVMNLVVNARDAMPKGGKLVIETALVELDEDYAQQHRSVVPGRYVMLAVSDTGHGMDAATQARIFEPFFTTKAPGEGTGLGLSTVYGIVRQSGGSIWVYSEPGEGTTFKIYLPIAAKGEEAVEERRQTAKPTGGSETVLVVEDEAGIRKMICAVLKKAGYTVLEARNGGDALRVSDGYAGSVQLLITDVVMPVMDGRDLVRRLATIRPDLKVLFMSGYTDDSIAHHGIIDPDTPFLQKPFTPLALAAKVREALGQSGKS